MSISCNRPVSERRHVVVCDVCGRKQFRLINNLLNFTCIFYIIIYVFIAYVTSSIAITLSTFWCFLFQTSGCKSVLNVKYVHSNEKVI